MDKRPHNREEAVAAVREHIRSGATTWPQAKPLEPEAVRWSSQLLTVLMVAAAVAAVIHAAVTPEHAMEAAEGNVPGWLPLAFAVGAGAGLIYAASLALVSVGRAWLAAGIVIHAPMAAFGLWSRTAGLPGAEVEPPTIAWSVSTFAELVVIVGAVLLLAWGPARIRLSRRQVVAGTILAVALGVVAFLAIPDAITHAQMLAAQHKPDAWLWGYTNGSLRPDAWLWGAQNGSLLELGNKWW